MLQAIRPGAELVAIHDSARPLVTAEDTRRCCQDALKVLARPLTLDTPSCVRRVVADYLVTLVCTTQLSLSPRPYSLALPRLNNVFWEIFCLLHKRVVELDSARAGCSTQA